MISPPPVCPTGGITIPSDMKKLKLYSILALLATAILLGAWLWLRGVVNDSSVSLSAIDERASMTPAAIDSIRSIGQWELSTVVLTTEVDTVQKRWLGLVKDRLKRSYTGRMSVGIDLRRLAEQCHTVDADTIRITLPDVCLLDTNFIDESKTRILVSDSEKMEHDAGIAKAMLSKARERMRRQGLTQDVMEQCRHRATDEITRRLTDIGYKKVVVSFGKSR